MENEKYSCVDCIWHEQCDNYEPCEFFDRGQHGLELSDDDLELSVESGRKEYDQEYQKYIQEFSDGNKE